MEPSSEGISARLRGEGYGGVMSERPLTPEENALAEHTRQLLDTTFKAFTRGERHGRREERARIVALAEQGGFVIPEKCLVLLTGKAFEEVKSGQRSCERARIVQAVEELRKAYSDKGGEADFIGACDKIIAAISGEGEE